MEDPHVLLGLAAVRALGGRRLPFAVEVVGSVRHEPDAPRRARLHGGLVAAYVVGVISGAALETPWRFWSLAIPVSVLALLAVATRRPTAISATS